MNFNTAAGRTIDIIEYMSSQGSPVTLAEIARNCGIPKSSALDLLYTLQEKNVIEMDNEQFKTYRLTTKVFQLGARVLDNDLLAVSEKILRKLAIQTNSTVFLGIPYHDQVLYIKKFEGSVTIQAARSVGDMNPMYFTGIGKAMLAAYSDEKVERIVGAGPYERKTARTLTTLEELLEDLRKVRTRGYAIDDREGVELIYCNAAPVYDANGMMVAAINNINVYTEMTREKMEEYPKLVMKAAVEISRQLGCRKETTY